MDSPLVIDATRLKIELSAETLEEIQWIVESARRFSTHGAEERVRQCLETKNRAGLATAAFVCARNSELSSRIKLTKWEETPVIIDVDERSDLLPWELVDFGGGPIGLICPSVTRRPKQAAKELPSPSDKRMLRVALVTARPYGGSDVPYLAISDYLRALISRLPDRIQLTVVRPPTFDALTDILAKEGGDFDILHFDGHGDLRPEGPILTFEDTENSALHIPASEVTALLKDSGLQLILLNACRSAQPRLPDKKSLYDPSERVSLAYQIASDAAIPVVAMRYLAAADLAGRFVGSFYEALLDGQPVGKAVQHGRRCLYGSSEFSNAVSLDSKDLASWLLPAYYNHSNDVVLIQPRELTGGQETSSVAKVYDRDKEFLQLERVVQCAMVPIIHGPIGAGKMELATAFAEWFQLTSGHVGHSQFELSVCNDDGVCPLDDLPRAVNEPSNFVIARATYRNKPPTSPWETDWFKRVLTGLSEGNAPAILVLDGAWRAAPERIEDQLIYVATTSSEGIGMHLKEVAPELYQQGIDGIIYSAVGNPMFARAIGSKVDLAQTRWFSRSAESYNLCEVAPKHTRALALFDRIINIQALRRFLHEIGELSQPVEYFYDRRNDQLSIERQALDALMSAGLLYPVTRNTYVINPWLKQHLRTTCSYEDASPVERLAFANAMAKLSRAYYADFFSRGIRKSAANVDFEQSNIARAWVTLEASHHFGQLLDLFSGLIAMWTYQGQADNIEVRAKQLNAQLIEGYAPVEVHEELVSLRLQAAIARGRVGDLANDICASARRALTLWRNEGEPRGSAAEGLSATYLLMLITKYNLARVLAATGSSDMHFDVCSELIEEFQKADFAHDVVHPLLLKTILCFAKIPKSERAGEIYKLLYQYYPSIGTGDKILQGEFLSLLADYSVLVAEGQDAVQFNKAVDEAVRWSEMALTLLPSGDNTARAGRHYRLGDCYWRKGETGPMDNNFLLAMDMYEKVGDYNSAAVAAASAALSWLAFRDKGKVLAHCHSANYYLERCASDDPKSHAARAILREVFLAKPWELSC
jgi:hypothetical protein